jgi:cytochrome c oxidase cbb3-type subunit 3
MQRRTQWMSVSAKGARSNNPAAFDERCIPPGGVAPSSNTAGILGRRALPDGRLARLGATRGFYIGLLGLTLALGLRAAAQAPAPAQPPAPAQTPAQPAQTPPEAGAHGQPAPPREDEEKPRFPAHQRPPAPPELLERGRAQFAGMCSACHGADARGGQLGGPNLLRSQLVLDDKDAELIIPVVQNGRPGPPPMPPLPVGVDDIKAIAAYVHSLQALSDNQGAPPIAEQNLNLLVGDAKAGEAFFAKACASCHSPTGDLQGIATRVPKTMALQNLWVSGGRATERGGPRRSSPPKPVTATVTLASGERVSGALLKLDDFLATLLLEDGTTRSFRRSGATPKIEVQDPLAQHKVLLTQLTNANMHDVTAYLSTFK